MSIYKAIENIDLLEYSQQFALFSDVANAIYSTEKTTQLQGRNSLIKVIDLWGKVPNSMKPLWEDLIEAVGFYPYIEKYKMTLEDLDARIRFNYHKSPFIDGKLLHKEQKALSDLLFTNRNVIVSAPTSFGKSLLIEEIVASNIYNNIVIIQPTLALLDETRLKLKKYSDNYRIIVRTSQQPAEDKGNIFLLTAERVLEYPNMPPVQLLILDEFYKLSSSRQDNRANILNIAFIQIMRNSNCKFYLLGPNIDEISKGFVQKYNAVFYKTEYSLVYTEEVNKYNDVKKKKGGKVVQDDIFNTLDEIDGQTLIFCSSPTTARGLAFEYCTYLEKKGIYKNNNIPLIDWITENLNADWSLVHCLANEIGVHDGSMPKHITTSTIKYFNENKLKYLFCTNTIIEGVNTSAKNVIYYDDRIGTRKVDYFDYANIRGRAGRLMEHCVGKIINLKKPPEIQKTAVDIPAYDQDPISDEVLVNIDRPDVKQKNLKRYDKFESLPDELKTILKRNAVSIQDQLKLLEEIKAKMLNPFERGDIIWKDLHDKNLYNHLVVIFNLVKDKFIEGNDKNVLISVNWMAKQTIDYCYEKNITKTIRARIEYKCKEYAKKHDPSYNEAIFSYRKFSLQNPVIVKGFVDEAIEKLFKFQKNWLQYKIPKWLNIVDSLQKYLAKQLKVPAGDYSFVSESIENEFIESNIRILTEYGIPSSAIFKLKEYFGKRIKDLSEDEVLNFIKINRIEVNKYLSKYEIESLDRCL